jgi:hypothetical protein
MAWELLAAVRGRWPLMLRTGWVVVRGTTIPRQTVMA